MRKPSVRSLARLAILGCGDILAIGAAFAGAYAVRFFKLSGLFDKFPPAYLLLMTAGYLCVFYIFDLYASFGTPYSRDLLGPAALAVTFGAFLALLLKYATSLYPIGRGLWVIGNVFLFVFLIAWRRIGAGILRRFSKPRRVAVIGAGPEMEVLRNIFQRHPDEFSVFDVAGGGPARLDLSSRGNAGGLDLIVLPGPLPQPGFGPDEFVRARLYGIEVAEAATLYPTVTGRIPIRLIPDDAGLFRSQGFDPVHGRTAALLKRLLDIGLSSVGLVVGLPLGLLIAAFIRLDSRGPIFYRQERVGRHEVVFSLIKFRSMIPGAEGQGAIWASANDHRVTRIGRILRKLHLDELPQLWNILRGDMSFIGPRPERPEFVSALKAEIPFYSLRHVVKPGLTGWAQVNYRYAASIEDSREKLEFDLYYISRMSLLLDARIAARTLGGVFLPKAGPR